MNRIGKEFGTLRHRLWFRLGRRLSEDTHSSVRGQARVQGIP
jgi:hypothetical protein